MNCWACLVWADWFGLVGLGLIGLGLIPTELYECRIQQAWKVKDACLIPTELFGCGITVENNNISCTSDQAIRYYGNDHVIQYNEIHVVQGEFC